MPRILLRTASTDDYLPRLFKNRFLSFPFLFIHLDNEFLSYYLEPCFLSLATSFSRALL